MSIEKGQSPLIDFAQKYFGDIEHLQPAIEFFQDNPELMDRLALSFDFAVGQLNSYLGQDIPEERAKLMPNVLKVQALLGKEKELPILYDLETDSSRENILTGIGVFKKTKELIESGEWQFTKEIDDEAHLAAAMMLEMYGQTIEQKKPELSGNGVTTMLAIEEVLALHSQHTDLFNAVYKQGWYSAEEGFSKELVSSIESKQAVKA